MMLKACCCNIRAILKRNIWLAALWFAVLFFALPVQAALRLQQARNAWYDPLIPNAAAQLIADTQNALLAVFSQQSMALVWILLLMAFMSALVFGSYMHKQRQVDFYHSQPPRRHTLLLQHAAAGLLAVFVPYVANLLLTVIVALAMGAITAFPWGAMLAGLAVHTLYFTAIFATALLAVVISGNGAVALITGVFLLSVLPSLLGLGLAIASEFYPVFYSRLYDWSLIIRWLSPAAAYVCVPLNGLPYTIAPIIVYDALALALAVWLYQKRPSETAGQAIGFKAARPLLKYTMAILAATVFAYVFHSIGNYSSNYFWWYFGAVTGGFLATQITEIVYAFDFRAIRRNLRGLAVFLIVYLALATCAMHDLGGFNSALPRADQVAKTEIYLTGVNGYTGETHSYYYGNRYTGGSADAEWRALERTERDTLARGPVTSPEGIAAAVNLTARFANAYLPENEQQPDAGEAQIARWQQEGKQYLLDYLNKEYDGYTYGYINPNTTSCRVVFTLNNGQTFARDYSNIYIPVQFLLDDIQTVYAEEEFRSAQLTELNLPDENYLPERIEIFELYYEPSPLPQFSMEQRSRLLAALRADLLELSVEEQQNNMPIGALHLRQYGGAVDNSQLDPEKSDRPYRMNRWPIYASFSRTLAFLAELGYGEQLWQPQLEAVVSANLINNQSYREYEKYGYSDPQVTETYASFSGAYSTATAQLVSSEGAAVTQITDAAQINELIAASYPSEAVEYNFFIDIDQSATLEVMYEGLGGQTYVRQRVFPY